MFATATAFAATTATTTTTAEAFGIICSICAFVLGPFLLRFKSGGGGFEGGGNKTLFSKIIQYLVKYFGGLAKSLIAFLAVIKIAASNAGVMGKAFISWLLGTRIGLATIGVALAIWIIWTFLAPIAAKRNKTQLVAVRKLYIYSFILFVFVSAGVVCGFSADKQIGFFESRAREKSKTQLVKSLDKIQASVDIDVSEVVEKIPLPSTDFTTPFKNWFRSPNPVLTPKNAILATGAVVAVVADIAVFALSKVPVKIGLGVSHALACCVYAGYKFKLFSKVKSLF